MSACRYRLVHMSVENDIQAKPMRRLTFSALPSEPFGDSAHPNGAITQLVTPEYAAKFTLGDDYSVSFREVES